MPHKLRLILHNIRSAHNVGVILRTADGAGVESIIMTGYTPYPTLTGDPRPPYVADKATRQIAKTALGAERNILILHFDTLAAAIGSQHKHNYAVAALEQAENATNLLEITLSGPTALILGNEVIGLNPAELALCESIWQIPMRGHKESLNVSSAAAIACYWLLR